MKVLFKGFAGERAQTRQIIFNNQLSLEDIVAVSGEKAPYMVQQEQTIVINQQLTQERKAQTMAKKRKVTDPLVNNTMFSNLIESDKPVITSKKVINEDEVMQLQRAVGADLLQYALSQCGDQPTLEQVQLKLKELIA